jgi:HK97 family phage prohead protease
MRTTEAVGHIRQSQDDPRVIEGIVVPYGQVAANTELGREAFAPGAFRDSASAWMGRTDGARLPFRPAHGQRNIGSVTHLEDTAAGLAFRAKIRDGARGDDYLSELADGMNGVSVEFNPTGTSRKTRDGVTVHRSAAIFGIAGSEAPAYDGARIATRDMEAAMSETEPTPVPEPTPTPTPVPTPEPPAHGAVEPITPLERAAVEKAAIEKYLNRSSITITRPELVYGRDSDYNYFHDDWKMKGSFNSQGRADAAERVRRHELYLQELASKMERDAYSRVFDPGFTERAGDVLSSEIPGAYPNDYLPGLLTPRIFKGRPITDSFQRIPISDARPRIFPKVTTSGTVATFAEGVAPTATDIATTAVTVTPSAYGTYTDVSRQALDGGDPSVLAIIFQDLQEGYRQASETAVKVAVEAGATASGTAITAATPWAGELANVIKYYATRFRPAEVAIVPSALYSVLLSQGDTTGRPFMPMIGAMNSDGTVQQGGISGNILGANAKLSWASTVNVNVFAASNDYVIFESAITQFTYDQVVGPQSVRVGLWAYLGIGTRLGGLSVTAA